MTSDLAEAAAHSRDSLTKRNETRSHERTPGVCVRSRRFDSSFTFSFWLERAPLLVLSPPDKVFAPFPSSLPSPLTPMANQTRRPPGCRSGPDHPYLSIQNEEGAKNTLTYPPTRRTRLSAPPLRLSAPPFRRCSPARRAPPPQPASPGGQTRPGERHARPG